MAGVKSLHSSVRLLLRGEVILLLLFMSDCFSTTDNLEVGKSMNVFGRYAYYGISMKVVPRNDSKGWLYREPTVDIFDNLTGAVSGLNKPKNSIHGEFHLECCENLEQLCQAYFREFKIEGIDDSWRAFTSSWDINTLARNFGIDVNYIKTPRSYILVRALRRRKSQKLVNSLKDAKLLPNVKALADQVTYGNKDSVMKFIKSYGSHYISSYSTGNSLYQVYVYHTPVFRRLKSRFGAQGINSLSRNELSTIFSPWYAEHVGLILSASGNSTVTDWAKKEFFSKAHLYPYTSLMKMYGNTKCFKQLDNLLQNEALLSMELKSLAAVFKDPEIKLWFLEILYNNLNLWEQTMYSFLGK